MRATGDKLEEKYIVPIARELAIALKAIHEEGIIHRDVKGTSACLPIQISNALISENRKIWN